MAQQKVTLEHQQVFSKSKVWQAQRRYYDQSGIDAWSGDVPCYITTNPFIAYHYAAVVAAFIEDWQKTHPSDDIDQPFYCVEIGAGHGQFGFYFLKKLQEIMHAKGVQKIPVCYVMTDFTQTNIEFWKKHPALNEFVESGLLDFAQFDFENDDALHLIHQDRVVARGDIHQPVVVFANYLFDSIVTDVFRVSDGRMEEALVSLTAHASSIVTK